MSKERGTYRSVKTVLLDGPDFQKLSMEARWAFVALKFSIGPSGIEVHYKEALLHEMSEKTGIPIEEGPTEGLRRAFEDLEEGGWIRWERNVIWLIGQLEHDPGLNPRDPKHRKSIQKHISGLPRLPIVGDFIRAHPDFFPPDELDEPPPPPSEDEGPSKGHRRASEGPSKGLATTEDRRTKREDRGGKTDAQAREADFSTSDDEPNSNLPDGSELPHPAGRMSASQVLHAWETRQPMPVPEPERRRQRQMARRIADNHTAEEVMAAMVGMGALFPHCPPKSEPWDLFDLDRKFVKALAKSRDHPEIRERQFERDFMALTERQA